MAKAERCVRLPASVALAFAMLTGLTVSRANPPAAGGAPKTPLTVLYDQTDSPASIATDSQNFEAAYDAYDCQAADDFVVTGGGWVISTIVTPGVYYNGSGPAASLHVTFYNNAAGLPGGVVSGCDYPTVTTFTGGGTGSFTTTLSPPCSLSPGTKWVSVQANMDFASGGQWSWTSRNVQSSNSAAWQNPGGAFGFGCTSYTTRTVCNPASSASPDQVFRLDGNFASCTGDAECQDGDLCNGAEVCVANSCTAGTPVNCDDGQFCTIDSCTPATGACSHAPNLCDDGDSCTLDACNEATDACDHSSPTPIHVCNAAGITIPSVGTATPYPSTINVSGVGTSGGLCSVELHGIVHTFPSDIDMLLVGPGTAQNAIVMSDAGGSTSVSGINLTLKDSAAQSIPTPLVTGTFKPTNTGSGDTFAGAPTPTGGSTLSAFDRTNPNGDWKLYVVDDSAGDAGSVAGGWCVNIVAGCATNADCDDSNACNGIETCATGVCVPGTPINCDDGNACTSDACVGGSCVGTPINCDDGNPCTDDSCNPAFGCVHANNTAPCDDGNNCTSDVCSGGSCVGTPINCDDGNACTSDACVGGSCVGTPINCDDGNPCTDDSCNPAFGCVHANNTAPCSDGLPCTTSDACSGGSCHGTPIDCNDGNLCTNDACNPSTGQCLHVNNNALCEDGNLCTTGDTCSGGVCVGGIDGRWTPTSTGTNAPSPRQVHTAVWTGTAMIVWGGYDGSSLLSTGGRYNPSTDQWLPTSIGANTPSARLRHRAVWTGTEMLVWGGWNQGLGGVLNTGARYNPANDTWTAISAGAHAPSARDYHTVVWTGSELIVWGGRGTGDVYLNDGARYNPTTDTWTPMSGINAPSARVDHTAVWTGTEMIIWGGLTDAAYENSGARYNPATDTWTPMSSGTNAPSARSLHTAVWTGSEMIVWGGVDNDGAPLASGARYNPVGDTWTTTSTASNVPAARSEHRAVWSGTEMIVWGGDASGLVNTGGRYDPVANAWRPTTPSGALPSGRYLHSLVWTGTALIVWGGSPTTNTGGSFVPGNNDGTSCSDGNGCTTNDTCSAGSCVGGPAQNCDDNDPCTLDSCSPATGCVHTGGDCVVAVDPPDDTTGVQVSTSVTLTYSASIDPATVTGSTFRLVGPGEVAVPAAYVVSTDGRRPTLNPVAALAADTTYRVETTSGILGPGATASQPFTSYFRTGAASGSTEISSVSEPTSPLPTSSRGGASIGRGGDLNGDAAQDVITGAPGYSDPDHGVPQEAGAALVYLGSTSAAERTAPDIIFTGASAHDRAGVAVAGDFDFNGDGRRDLVIGAEQVDRTTNPNTPAPTGNGKVYLIFFDPTDAAHYPNIGNPAVPDVVSLSLVGQPGGIPGVVFTGVALGDQVGFSVAGGGTSTPGGGQDILIGAPGADPGGRTDAGAVYVVFDSPALTGNISLTRISSGLPDQVPGKAYFGASAGDNLGFSTAFGGDVIQGQTAGTGSVLMGAPRASGGRGLSVCPPGDPDTTPIIVDAVGSTVPGIQLKGTQDGEQVGYSVASGGDALADGVPDLLIGAPTYDVAGGAFSAMPDAGRVLQTTQVFPSGVYNADAVGSSIHGVVWTGEAAGDQLGVAVASVQDVTGDGYDDIVLGAPFVDPVIGGISQADAGAVYLIAGSPASGNLGTISVAAVGETIAGQEITGTVAGEHTGSSIAGTGDISGDGRSDFAVGAPDSDAQAGTVDLVLHSAPSPVGNCGPAGCVVADLATGAEVDVRAGALAAPLNVGVDGLTDPGSLPAPVPPGTMLLGAARFTPDGHAVSSPFATAYIPIRSAAATQSAPGEMLPISYFNGSGWAPAGINGSTGANPSYPSQRAVGATVDVLRIYAVFVSDADGDGVRDSVDNCPSVANPAQTDTDHDGIGDACECVNVNCDDGNVCTDDGCDPLSGCVHTNNSVSCDDGNPCTVGDVCGGGSCSGAPVPGPGELQNSRFTDKSTFVWDTLPNSPHYDIVRGELASLPVGPGGADESCFDDLLSAVLVDAATPAQGTGYWYVVRGESACGNGTYGYRSNGTERVTTTCP